MGPQKVNRLPSGKLRLGDVVATQAVVIRKVPLAAKAVKMEPMPAVAHQQDPGSGHGWIARPGKAPGKSCGHRFLVSIKADDVFTRRRQSGGRGEVEGGAGSRMLWPRTGLFPDCGGEALIGVLKPQAGVLTFEGR